MSEEAKLNGRKALSVAEKLALLTEHIPHRYCLLVTYRERLQWYRGRIGQADGDLLRTSKDSALISMRLFANFLGLAIEKKKLAEKQSSWHADDVFVDMVGGEFVHLNELSPDEARLLEGLLTRADKELAHLTCTYAFHDEFNTAKALVEGISLIERLLLRNLFRPLERPLPDLKKERSILDDGWNFPDRPAVPPQFPRSPTLA